MRENYDFKNVRKNGYIENPQKKTKDSLFRILNNPEQNRRS